MRSSKILSFLFLLSFVSACSTPSTPTPDPNFVFPTNIIVPTQPACTTLYTEPTPGPETPSIFPPITPADHTRGPEDAVVTILDYSDYQDPVLAY
jgi:hypothetical protein